MIFRKKNKPSQEEKDKARVWLVLRFGTMQEAAYRWSIAIPEEREDVYTPAQKATILDYIKDRKSKTSCTGPR